MLWLLSFLFMLSQEAFGVADRSTLIPANGEGEIQALLSYPTTVSISNPWGNIEVLPAPPESHLISVQARSTVSAWLVLLEPEPGKIVIRLECSDCQPSGQTQLRIEIPDCLHLKVSSRSGNISISNIPEQTPGRILWAETSGELVVENTPASGGSVLIYGQGILYRPMQCLAALLREDTAANRPAKHQVFSFESVRTPPELLQRFQ